MIDFVEYLRAKLNTLSDSTYSIGVYDEVNYNFENPEDIVFIFSGNAYVQSDYSKKVYTQTFGLSVYTEKDGFEYASNLALELFKSINNTTEIISEYSTRIEIQSPVVLNVYGALQNGLTNVLQMTGVLHLAHVTELAVGNHYQIDYVEMFPINPIISVNVVSNTENESGVGVTHPNYYTFEANFSIWDDDSEAADIMRQEIGMANARHRFLCSRGPLYNTSQTIGPYQVSVPSNWPAMMSMLGYTCAIKNSTGSDLTFNLGEYTNCDVVCFDQWNDEIELTSVNVANNKYVVFLGKEPISGTTRYIQYYKLANHYQTLNIDQSNLITIVTYATDTQSGFSTFNVKMVK